MTETETILHNANKVIAENFKVEDYRMKLQKDFLLLLNNKIGKGSIIHSDKIQTIIFPSSYTYSGLGGFNNYTQIAMPNKYENTSIFGLIKTDQELERVYIRPDNLTDKLLSIFSNHGVKLSGSLNFRWKYHVESQASEEELQKIKPNFLRFVAKYRTLEMEFFKNYMIFRINKRFLNEKDVLKTIYLGLQLQEFFKK